MATVGAWAFGQPVAELRAPAAAVITPLAQTEGQATGRGVKAEDERTNFRISGNNLELHPVFFQQKLLMDEIERKKEVDLGELFKKYQDSFHDPLGERAYRNQMEQLVQTGLVREAGEGRWKKFEVS